MFMNIVRDKINNQSKIRQRQQKYQRHILQINTAEQLHDDLTIVHRQILQPIRRQINVMEEQIPLKKLIYFIGRTPAVIQEILVRPQEDREHDARLVRIVLLPSAPHHHVINQDAQENPRNPDAVAHPLMYQLLPVPYVLNTLQHRHVLLRKNVPDVRAGFHVQFVVLQGLDVRVYVGDFLRAILGWRLRLFEQEIRVRFVRDVQIMLEIEQVFRYRTVQIELRDAACVVRHFGKFSCLIIIINVWNFPWLRFVLGLLRRRGELLRTCRCLRVRGM